MWQLYQFPLCPFSRKVRLLLGEKGIAYDLINEHPQPVSPHEVRSVTDLLEWLSTGNFVLLGYREYRRQGEDYEGVPGSGLGILRDEQDDDTARTRALAARARRVARQAALDPDDGISH